MVRTLSAFTCASVHAHHVSAHISFIAFLANPVIAGDAIVTCDDKCRVLSFLLIAVESASGVLLAEGAYDLDSALSAATKDVVMRWAPAPLTLMFNPPWCSLAICECYRPLLELSPPMPHKQFAIQQHLWCTAL